MSQRVSRRTGGLRNARRRLVRRAASFWGNGSRIIPRRSLEALSTSPSRVDLKLLARGPSWSAWTSPSTSPSRVDRELLFAMAPTDPADR